MANVFGIHLGMSQIMDATTRVPSYFFKLQKVILVPSYFETFPFAAARAHCFLLPPAIDIVRLWFSQQGLLATECGHYPGSKTKDVFFYCTLP